MSNLLWKEFETIVQENKNNKSIFENEDQVETLLKKANAVGLEYVDDLMDVTQEDDLDIEMKDEWPLIENFRN